MYDHRHPIWSKGILCAQVAVFALHQDGTRYELGMSKNWDVDDALKRKINAKNKFENIRIIYYLCNPFDQKTGHFFD